MILVFYHIFFEFFINIFEFLNLKMKKWRKVPEFHFPVTSGNEKKTEISAKFRRKVKPWAGSEVAKIPCLLDGSFGGFSKILANQILLEKFYYNWNK